MTWPDTIRYTDDHLREVRDPAARAYLRDHGIPRVDAFLENGPEGLPRTGPLLLLGYAHDPDAAFFLDPATGTVHLGVDGRTYFANSTPQQFVASFAAYTEITRSPDGDDAVWARLKDALHAIDPAALEDRTYFWWDTLDDIAMGIY